MADVLVPVGRHLFTPDYLKELASTITPEEAGPLGLVAKFGADSDGASVAVLFSPKGDHFVARAAYRYDRVEGNKFGADATLKF